jgi:phosphatidylserine/phosphatidylglycerophosphate/cardiolipin synthase-like enzyme
MVICSPFISNAAAYREDIDRRLLYNTATRGVEIFFVCTADDPSLPEFRDFLASIRSHNVHLLAISHFHLKTIVVDNELIAEGSFNWLSASRDEKSDFHNHETTIAIRGNMAKELIADFYNSAIGRMILQQGHDISQIPLLTPRL